MTNTAIGGRVRTDDGVSTAPPVPLEPALYLGDHHRKRYGQVWRFRRQNAPLTKRAIHSGVCEKVGHFPLFPKAIAPFLEARCSPERSSPRHFWPFRAYSAPKPVNQKASAFVGKTFGSPHWMHLELLRPKSGAARTDVNPLFQ